jgi:hypothetical protein
MQETNVNHSAPGLSMPCKIWPIGRRVTRLFLADRRVWRDIVMA